MRILEGFFSSPTGRRHDLTRTHPRLHRDEIFDVVSDVLLHRGSYLQVLRQLGINLGPWTTDISFEIAAQGRQVLVQIFGLAGRGLRNPRGRTNRFAVVVVDRTCAPRPSPALRVVLTWPLDDDFRHILSHCCTDMCVTPRASRTKGSRVSLDKPAHHRLVAGMISNASTGSTRAWMASIWLAGAVSHSSY